MFLVGMCDIFLILYLTTLSQVNQNKTSHLTVDDYNKAKEEETLAKEDAEKTKIEVSELKNSALELANEKKRALQLADYAEAEAIAIFKQLEQSEEERKKAKEAEAKALISAKLEQEKALQTKDLLAKAISKKDDFVSKLQEAEKSKLIALKQYEEEKLKLETILRNKENVIKVAKEVKEAKQNELEALKKAEDAKQKEAEALKIALTAKKDAESAKEKEKNALELKLKLQLEAETARKNREEALRLSIIAKKKEEEALDLQKKALLEAQKAKEEKEKALAQARKAQEEARIAKENEAKALDLANSAQEETTRAYALKEAAVQGQRVAEKKAATAMSIASEAKRETAATNKKIRTITQTADNAFDDNIKDKIITVKVVIEYGSRSSKKRDKTIFLQGVPVKVNNRLFIFTLVDQIGLWKSFSPEKYLSYKITVDGQPISNLYIKPGTTKIAALEIENNIGHSLPLGEIYDFSSYMPVLFSIRGQSDLGVVDKVRGVGDDFFVFKRDYLRMISMDEFYFGTEGIRGTGDYSEYIIKGDQIVDLGGKFVGLAYKKNTIMRIYKLKGWHKISINDLPAPDLVTLVRALTRS